MPLPLMPFQYDGALRMVSRPRWGCHDEMGVGKTAQCIYAADMIQATRGIVICPAHLRQNWIDEFYKFSSRQIRIVKGIDRHDFQAWMKGRFGYLVTSYELAAKWAPAIMESYQILDFVIFDEAHYVKNPEASRTRILLGAGAQGFEGSLCMYAKHVWHVTGTPMTNDPMDIYTFLKLMGAVQLGYEPFLHTFFDPHRGAYGVRTTVKPDMLAPLQQIIRNNSLRRTKQDVGIQLPPIFFTSTTIDGDADEIKKMLIDFPGLEQIVINAVQNGGLSLINKETAHVMTLRRLLGEAKAIPYAHMLIDELKQDGEKRVVFGVHVEALSRVHNILTRAGIKSVLVSGAVTAKQAEKAVWDFQHDPKVQVFIGNIRKAGTGITLTAACEIDMMESEWSPGPNSQTIYRIHRIGQERKCRARFIALANTFDTTITDIVIGKTLRIAQIDGFTLAGAPLT